MDEQRLPRLTELAQKAWPETDLHVQHETAMGLNRWRVRVSKPHGKTLLVSDHGDRFEAALCALAGEPSEAEVERDQLKRHYDAAAPEHNLPALLDLYEERESAAKDELATLRERLATLSADWAGKDPRCAHMTSFDCANELDAALEGKFAYLDAITAPKETP